MRSEKLFIDRWKDGDQRAAEELYNHYRLPLYRFAYGMLGNQADAEEVMQDSLLYALRKIHSFDPGRASFKTWLHTICVSRARNKRRRKQFSLVALSDWLTGDRDIEATETRVAASAEISARNLTVLQAVHTLPAKQREAVLLRFWAGLSFLEIASALNCAPSTAKSRVHLAYSKLRLTLTDLENDAFVQEALR